MSLDLNAIKARAEAATPGPWALCDFNEGTSHPPLWGAVNPPYFNPLDHPDQEAAEVQISVGCYEDAEFVAHAREDVPALLALVERQAAELARCVERLDRRTAELRDAHNDLLDVRGILSPAGYEPVTPLSLVPTVAPAVQWLVDRLAAVEQDRDQARAELARYAERLDLDAWDRLEAERDRLGAEIEHLTTRLGRTLAQRNAARSRAHLAHSGTYDTCLRMPCMHWRAEEAAEHSGEAG